MRSHKLIYNESKPAYTFIMKNYICLQITRRSFWKNTGIGTWHRMTLHPTRICVEKPTKWTKLNKWRDPLGKLRSTKQLQLRMGPSTMAATSISLSPATSIPQPSLTNSSTKVEYFSSRLVIGDGWFPWFIIYSSYVEIYSGRKGFFLVPTIRTIFLLNDIVINWCWIISRSTESI